MGREMPNETGHGVLQKKPDSKTSQHLLEKEVDFGRTSIAEKIQPVLHQGKGIAAERWD